VGVFLNSVVSAVFGDKIVFCVNNTKMYSTRFMHVWPLRTKI